MKIGSQEHRDAFCRHFTQTYSEYDPTTLLREYRGDGHVALLLTEGLDGLGALITHAATGGIPAEALRTTRAWTVQEWAAGVERIREQGWLDDGPGLALSEAGQRRRQAIEDRTDELAVYPYEGIGDDGCARSLLPRCQLRLWERT